MTKPLCRLVLVSPPAPDLAVFTADLESTFAAGDIATLILALDSDDTDAWHKAADIARPVAVSHDAAFLLADRLELVQPLDADGVHISRPDESLGDIAKGLKPARIVGAGGIFNRHTAMKAGESGVDYVMFGQFDLNPDDRKGADTVKNLTEWWVPVVEIPCVAFAATLDQAGVLAGAGADFVALKSAVWDHEDGPAKAVEAVTKMFEHS